MALSKQPNVRFNFFLNLDRCQESNLNNYDGNTSSDCSRLTSLSFLAYGALYFLLYTVQCKLLPFNFLTQFFTKFYTYFVDLIVQTNFPIKCFQKIGHPNFPPNYQFNCFIPFFNTTLSENFST